MSEYQEIFVQRGLSYDTAMQRYPSARDKEFQRLFEGVNLNTISKVLDIPSGGGYLEKHLPNQSVIDCFEPCNEFNPQNSHATNVDLENVAISKNTYDLVVCLAAIHHVDNKERFLKNCIASLRDNGYFCLGDVVGNSSIADFLDNFAGAHNGTGHQGNYLKIDTISEIIKGNKLNLISNSEKKCPWVFDKIEDMTGFCRLLFGINDVDDQTLIDALQHYIGFTEENKKVYLHWKLLYITLQKTT